MVYNEYMQYSMTLNKELKMKLSLVQQIINFIDANSAITFSQFSKEFKGNDAAFMLFEELLNEGAIRQVKDNPLLGTYKYTLAA